MIEIRHYTAIAYFLLLEGFPILLGLDHKPLEGVWVTHLDQLSGGMMASKWYGKGEGI